MEAENNMYKSVWNRYVHSSILFRISFFNFCVQVNLRSVGRKRFAHLSEAQDEIHVDANIPWGEDTLFTLEFRADEGGRYALHTCNNR